MKRLLFALILITLCTGQARAKCALELILAIDVSGSISPAEYRIQMDGLADAFRNPQIHAAMRALDGDVMATVTHWSGTSRQQQAINWTRLDDDGAARRFAERIQEAPRAFRNFSTAIGEALAHAGQMSAGNPESCARRVVDVSGDGVNNEGRATAPERNRLVAAGWTINGLVIRGSDPDPVSHYRSVVIGGAGAFLEIAESFDDYPRAIIRKLLREIDPDEIMAMAPR